MGRFSSPPLAPEYRGEGSNSRMQIVNSTLLRPREFLVANAVRLVGVGAQALFPLRLVGLVIALAPHRLAVALERQDVRGNAVQKPAVVADDHRTAAEVQEPLLQGAERI